MTSDLLAKSPYPGYVSKKQAVLALLLVLIAGFLVAYALQPRIEVDMYACYYGANSPPVLEPFCTENNSINACPPFTERKHVQKTVFTIEDIEAFNALEVTNPFGNKTI